MRFALIIALVALVVGLAVLIGADLTDAFDQAIIDVVRAPALHDLLSPLRGVILGGAQHRLSVSVNVVPVDSGGHAHPGSRADTAPP